MKFLKYIFLFLAVAIWIVSMSPKWSSQLAAADSYRYGDLYRLSNLSEFKDPRKECIGYRVPQHPKFSKKVHLYVIGDSFTEKERIGKKDFVADEYTYVHWSEVLHIKPDTSQTNILLLECVERHVREKFMAPIKNLVPDSATFKPKNAKLFMTELDDAFESKKAENRIDELLFQNDFILGLKELKSDFNYKVFGRTNKEVTSINNGKDLVYYMDTDTPETTSSFSKIKNSALDSIVDNINQTEQNAVKIGFDHVLLSIIPNKVSVLAPTYDVYNHLIDRIYAHPNLHLQYVDVYEDFKKLGNKSYLKGDSHWTCEGQYLWLNKVNHKIIRILQLNQLPF